MPDNIETGVNVLSKFPPMKHTEVTIKISGRRQQKIKTNTELFSLDVEVGLLIINFEIEGLDGKFIPLDLTGHTDILIGIEFVGTGTKELRQPCEVLDLENGKVSVMLPNDKYNYEGEVVVYTYVHFEDGRKFDGGVLGLHFRESWIDAILPEMAEFYVQRFEDLAIWVEGRTTEILASISGDLDITFNADWNELENRPSAFPPSAHGHDITEIENYESVDLTAVESRIENLEITMFGETFATMEQVESKLDLFFFQKIQFMTNECVDEIIEELS